MDREFGHSYYRVSNFKRFTQMPFQMVSLIVTFSLYIFNINLIDLTLFPVNWYQLLKILQKCGQIEKFDMIFHKSGPLAGQARGYAFVTYREVKYSHFIL